MYKYDTVVSFADSHSVCDTKGLDLWVICYGRFAVECREVALRLV